MAKLVTCSFPWGDINIHYLEIPYSKVEWVRNPQKATGFLEIKWVRNPQEATEFTEADGQHWIDSMVTHDYKCFYSMTDKDVAIHDFKLEKNKLISI